MTKIIEIIENLTKYSAARKIDEKMRFFIDPEVLVAFRKKVLKKRFSIAGFLLDLRRADRNLIDFEAIMIDLMKNMSILLASYWATKTAHFGPKMS